MSSSIRKVPISPKPAVADHILLDQIISSAESLVQIEENQSDCSKGESQKNAQLNMNLNENATPNSQAIKKFYKTPTTQQSGIRGRSLPSVYRYLSTKSNKNKPIQQKLNKTNYDFGFIKADKLIGSNEVTGLLDSKFFISNLQEYQKMDQLCMKRDDLSPIKEQKRCNSVLDNMEDYVCESTEIKKKFVEQMMNKRNLEAHRKYLDHEFNEQSILEKLNNHIEENMSREKYKRLAQTSYFKKGKADQTLPQNKENTQNIEPIKVERDLDGGEISPNRKRKMVKTEQEKKREQDEKILTLIQGNQVEAQQAPQISLKTQIKIQNQKALKGRFQNIVSNHEKAIQDIDFAFSDVTEKIKKEEILKRISKLTEQVNQQNQQAVSQFPQQQQQQQQQQNQQNHQQKIINQTLFPTSTVGFSELNKEKTQNGFGFPSIIIQDQKTTSQNFYKNQNTIASEKSQILLHPSEPTKKQQLLFPVQTNQEHSTISDAFISKEYFPQNFQYAFNEAERPSSRNGKLNKVEKLEMQKHALQVNQQRVEDEDKLYHQDGFIKRKKELMVDISRQNNRDKVLDRVMMSYFHQYDIINTQSLKKRGISEDSQLSSLLSQFQPQHLRLQFKDIQKLNNSRVRVKSQNCRNYTETSAHIDSDDIFMTEGHDEENYAHLDLDIYKEKFQWKKDQNKAVNYSKFCLPAQKVLQFMKQNPFYKKQQNINAIDFLVALDPMKPLEETVGSEQKAIDQKQKEEEIILRRCFFWLSNKNDIITSQRYQEISKESFLNFFLTLSKVSINEISDADSPRSEQQNLPEMKNQLVIGGITEETIISIFTQLTKNKDKKVLKYYEFLASLHKVSVQYYLKSIRQDNQKKPSELFQKFMDNVISPNHLAFREQEEVEIIQMRANKEIDNLLIGFEEQIKELFILAASLRSTHSQTLDEMFLSFQELFELIEKLGFFPTKISKVNIKYFYSYSLIFDKGLHFQDFCTCFHLIGLHVIRTRSKFSKQTITSFTQIQKENRHIQFAIFKLKQENQLNVPTKKFIRDISFFYYHSDYINLSQIQDRINKIKDLSSKLQQQ